MRELTPEMKRRIDASEKWPVRMETEIHEDGDVSYSVSVGGTQDTDNGFIIWGEMATRGSVLDSLIKEDMEDCHRLVLEYLGAK